MTPWLVIFIFVAALMLFYGFRAAARRERRPLPGREQDDHARAPGQDDDGPGRVAVLGPDQTNVNPPESYVVHHEGKGQGMDIANRALQERTGHLTADAPGQGPVHAPVPGRTPVTEERAGEAAGPGPAGATAAGTDRRGAGPDRVPGPQVGRDGVPDDGAAGKRVAAADTHVEAAAELAYPYRPAPFVGDNRREFPAWAPPAEAIRERAADVAARLERGPLPSHPGQGALDPGRHGEADDPGHWAPLRDTGALPERYGVDEVVFLPRDPYQAYVYWELGGPGEGALDPAALARTRRVLRVYDLTCGTWEQVDLEPEQDHHWLALPHPGHAYRVEVGRAGAGGEWYPLAQSRAVGLPPAPVAEEPWAAHLRAGAWSPGGRP